MEKIQLFVTQEERQALLKVYSYSKSNKKIKSVYDIVIHRIKLFLHIGLKRK